MKAVVESMEMLPLVLRIPPALEMTDDQFFDFCQLNDDLRLERRRRSHRDRSSGRREDEQREFRNHDATTALGEKGRQRRWVRSELRISSSEQRDACSLRVRVSRSRLERLSAEEKKKFLPLCPEFVIESGLRQIA